ncbi:MAG: AI-2E family transporter [Candidatus Calescibacterium sp.]|nr:AI-2E family transporter [Candidatus Calescibacterium sp.]MDW8132364.1 AI-2E family transporter [Candidatus Calescibacterium sp.]
MLRLNSYLFYTLSYSIKQLEYPSIWKVPKKIKRNYKGMYSEKINKVLYFLLIVITIIILYKISLFFIDILIIYFLMLFFSIVIKPVVDRLNSKYSVSRELSTLVIIIFVLIIIITLLLILIPNIYSSITDIFKTLQENLNSILIAITNILNKYLHFLDIKIESNQIQENLLRQLNQNIPQITEKIVDIALSGTKIIFNILLIAVLTFYMIKDYEKIRSYKIKVISWISNIPKEKAEEIALTIETVLRKFLFGQLFAATYIFLFTLISLYLFNVKEYFIVALIAGIFELIPFIGAFIALSISTLFLLNKGIINIIAFLIIAIIAYQVLAKIIYPNIVGKILNISVITVLISIIIGFKLYGIFGMFISVPTISIIKILIDKKINQTH